MPASCRITGCKMAVVADLEATELCISHFTLEVERSCNDMRLEAGLGTATKERRGDILRYIGEQGALLARIATTSPRLPDEQKARILSTFLTLMNLRESLDRAAARQGAPPSAAPQTSS